MQKQQKIEQKKREYEEMKERRREEMRKRSEMKSNGIKKVIVC